MILQKIEGEFSVYKVTKLPAGLMEQEFVFVGRTDKELSVISETRYMPRNVVVSEQGWKCFRIAEDASFEKYGMISFLANIIAARKTSTLVVGTYDTDYLFIKEDKFEEVVLALTENGCTFISDSVSEK